MRNMHNGFTRRDFLKATACGVLGGLVAAYHPKLAAAVAPPTERSRAALVTGDSRSDNIFKALKMIEGDIKKGLSRKKRVVIKPNLVAVDRQLAATHADSVEATLEFLKPLVKDEIIIAESPGGAPAAEGFDNYGYNRLAKKYKVKFVDLDEEPFTIGHVIDEHFRPQPVRFSQLLLDPGTYII